MKQTVMPTTTAALRSINVIVVFLFVFSLQITTKANAEIDAVKIVKSVENSIVCIYTIEDDKFLKLGSGIIVKENGVILTNFHVILGAQSIVIKLKDGTIFDDVDIVDYNQRLDIAVLKIKAIKLKPARLGDSDNVKVGEEILAIGNPEGLEYTISKGIISQIRDDLDKRGYKVLFWFTVKWRDADFQKTVA